MLDTIEGIATRNDQLSKPATRPKSHTSDRPHSCVERIGEIETTPQSIHVFNGNWRTLATFRCRRNQLANAFPSLLEHRTSVPRCTIHYVPETKTRKPSVQCGGGNSTSRISSEGSEQNLRGILSLLRHHSHYFIYLCILS